MKIENRQQLLTIVVIAVGALFAADKLVISPLIDSWKQRSTRIEELRKQAAEGNRLLDRAQALRSRWQYMRTNTLPNDASLAEQRVFSAFERWSQGSRVSLNSILPQWKHDAEDFITLECHVEATGNLAAVTQFLFEIEKDPMALRLETMEISARDAEGQVLSLGLQLSGLVLIPQEQKP